KASSPEEVVRSMANVNEMAPTSQSEGQASFAVHGASLELDKVTKEYEGLTAVDEISLRVEPGEFVTLLGASGSGKTTLLRIIAGFTEATRGGVILDGEPITSVPIHKRNIGMVFQSYALFPHMTVRKNILF